MNRKLLFLTIIFISLGINAQVGVKTESPQGVFHIDGQGNTSGNTNVSDDVVVTAAGNVGIGTNAPATKVDIRTSTVNTGFRLQDGSEGNGMILTSDANGNGKWSAPGFSEFTKIPASACPFSISTGSPRRTVFETSAGNPYIIELPSYGTYSLTMGFYMSFSNLAANSTISYAIIQLLPDNDLSLWDNNIVPKFEGAYEVYGVPGSTGKDYRVYLSENITVTAATGKKVYIAVSLNGSNLPSPIEGTMYIGQSAACKHCAGGSYVRIN